ncbi:DUF2818 family protein [beta proteobacterium MWH-UniP1]
MNTGAAAVLLLVIATVLANLPFFTERFFGVFRKPEKTIWWRLLELIVFYGVFLLIGFGLESYVGRSQSQMWQFYAITGLMFLILAYPGFVWRYLRRGRSKEPDQ